MTGVRVHEVTKTFGRTMRLTGVTFTAGQDKPLPFGDLASGPR
jgi:hypothetical protein